jgi:hypothetical protein
MATEEKLIEPGLLTQPTREEYDEAMYRMHAAAGGQGIRDIHTAFWYGWNLGVADGERRRPTP